MKNSILILIFLTSTYVMAEIPMLEAKSRPVPQWNLKSPKEFATYFKFKLMAPLPPSVKIDVDALAYTLRAQFEKALLPLSDPAPACSSAEAPAYALALRTAGRLQDCIDYAVGCAKDHMVVTPMTVLQGAQCAATRYDYGQADRLFEEATASRFVSSKDFSESVYAYASYATYGIHESLDQSILDRNPSWTKQEKRLWRALLSRAADADLGAYTKAEVDQFLNQQIHQETGSFGAFLKSLRLSILFSDMDYPAVLHTLESDAGQMNNPLLWYDLAYFGLYYGLDADFAKARMIYDVYDHYAHAWSKFPTEENTYNYTEIYGNVCSGKLLQGIDLKNFNALKVKIRSGQLSAEEAAKQVEIWTENFPAKADVLTAYAGLLSMNGKHAEAMDTYWRAHRSCRYYHRANWGLTLEKRFFRYSQRPDYDAVASKVTTELSRVQIPSEINQYFLNWNSLGAEAKKRVQYGARIWLPYMAQLNQQKMNAYIKYAFDLLSESPGMAGMKDQRIGGAGYPNDNRLWDDVRGAGGNIVIADLSEVFQTVQGDFNLLGHEMTHQYQTFLQKNSTIGIDCVRNLYAKALLTHNFPDAYASYNAEEHFAQGVTYYLIPKDAPKKFGLNQLWLEKNNLDLLGFIQSIEKSNGDLNKLGCPI